MKKLAYSLLLAAAVAIGSPGAVSWAQPDADENGPSSLVTPQLPAGHVARYRVTYFNSQTANALLRSASIVSITNQNAATCNVSVDWKVGFGGVVCTSSIALGPGNTADFCTRPIPGGITICNATCPGAGLLNHEGSGIVGSANVTGCERIAVSARTVYTQTTSDAPVSAITDAKVVRINLGNSGD